MSWSRTKLRQVAAQLQAAAKGLELFAAYKETGDVATLQRAHGLLQDMGELGSACFQLKLVAEEVRTRSEWAAFVRAVEGPLVGAEDIPGIIDLLRDYVRLQWLISHAPHALHMLEEKVAAEVLAAEARRTNAGRARVDDLASRLEEVLRRMRDYPEMPDSLAATKATAEAVVREILVPLHSRQVQYQWSVRLLGAVDEIMGPDRIARGCLFHLPRVLVDGEELMYVDINRVSAQVFAGCARSRETVAYLLQAVEAAERVRDEVDWKGLTQYRQRVTSLLTRVKEQCVRHLQEAMSPLRLAWMATASRALQRDRS